MDKIFHLTEHQVASEEPICYSILYESTPERSYWYVSFAGDRQITLSLESGATMRFTDKSVAEEYCAERWPYIRYLNQSQE